MLETSAEKARELMRICEFFEEEAGNLEKLEVTGKKELAQYYLLFDGLMDGVDMMVKAMRKSRELMASKILAAMEAEEVTAMEVLGFRFTPFARGYFHVPSRTNHPQEHVEFIAWMKEDGEGQAFLRDAIDGKKFSKWCAERLERGLTLPPHVSQYIEPTVKVKEVRS